MREIKFRAWDKHQNKMTPGVEWLLPLWGLLDLQRFGEKEYSQLGTAKERWEMMQYTGLKDKNGTEIYEGDIVKFKTTTVFDCERDDYKEMGEERKPQVVQFVDGEFCPKENYNYCEDGFYASRDFDFEVIGNIYENPELLT